MRALALTLPLCLTLACSGEAPPPEFPPPAPEAKVNEPDLPDHFIDRGRLEVVLKQGPGWFLSRVPIVDVQDKGKFVGWKLEDVPLEWRGIDIQAGDVITAVNAMPIETPSDFWAAWTTLSVASELKVAYQREGEPRELSIPILGQPSAAVAKDLQAQQGEAPPAPPAERRMPQRKRTVVIKSNDKPIQETMVDWSDEK